jgi:hypothetical protein
MKYKNCFAGRGCSKYRGNPPHSRIGRQRLAIAPDRASTPSKKCANV